MEFGQGQSQRECFWKLILRGYGNLTLWGKCRLICMGLEELSYHLLFLYHIQHSLSRNYSGTVLCFSQVTSKYSLILLRPSLILIPLAQPLNSPGLPACAAMTVLILSLWVLCLHAYLCTTWVWCLWRPEGVSTDDCELPCGCWKFYLGPLDKQSSQR